MNTETPLAGLLVVATPIGNLGDISIRAQQVLRDVDAIACEDTRHTRKLLSACGITGKRLLAVHEHNEIEAADGIVGLLVGGKTVALVTDAGTPGISDPGERVIAAVIAAGMPLTCVPGPSAVIVALVLSGLDTTRFTFEGFLPRKGRERTDRISELATERRTVVLYESPQRVATTLADLREPVGGDRRIAVCRELTKRFETVWRGTLADAPQALGEPRGEYVLVLEGAPAPVAAIHDDDIRIALHEHLAAGTSVRDSVAAVVAATGAPRRQVYALAVQHKRN